MEDDAARGTGWQPDTNAPSDEERAILALMSEGHTDAHIARTLGLTRRTMQRRLQRAMEKLGAVSRFQAGVLAERGGWFQGDPPRSGPAHARQRSTQELRHSFANDITEARGGF